MLTCTPQRHTLWHYSNPTEDPRKVISDDKETFTETKITREIVMTLRQKPHRYVTTSVNFIFQFMSQNKSILSKIRNQ